MDLASAKVKIRHVFGATCFRRVAPPVIVKLSGRDLHRYSEQGSWGRSLLVDIFSFVFEMLVILLKVSPKESVVLIREWEIQHWRRG